MAQDSFKRSPAKPKVSFKRGKSADLDKTTLVDGQISVTTDDGRIHVDYNENGELKRKTLYSGQLKIGPHIYDGTQDVEVGIYSGEVAAELSVDLQSIDKLF